MKRLLSLLLVCFLTLFLALPTTALYSETATFISNGNSEYFYTLDSYSDLYIEEYNYIDVSIVIDYFDFDSISVFDVELFLAGEDYDGFTVFEYSSGILVDYLTLDGDELIVEFDVYPTYDWPSVVYLYVSGEFSEDTTYGVYDTLDYSDDVWFEMGFVDIYERRNVGSPGFMLPITATAILLLIVIVNPRKLY